VALTGYDSPECRAAAFDAGCIGYITKPIETTEFVSQIAQLLPVER